MSGAVATRWTKCCMGQLRKRIQADGSPQAIATLDLSVTYTALRARRSQSCWRDSRNCNRGRVNPSTRSKTSYFLATQTDHQAWQEMTKSRTIQAPLSWKYSELRQISSSSRMEKWIPLMSNHPVKLKANWPSWIRNMQDFTRRTIQARSSSRPWKLKKQVLWAMAHSMRGSLTRRLLKFSIKSMQSRAGWVQISWGRSSWSSIRLLRKHLIFQADKTCYTSKRIWPYQKCSRIKASQASIQQIIKLLILRQQRWRKWQERLRPISSHQNHQFSKGTMWLWTNTETILYCRIWAEMILIRMTAQITNSHFNQFLICKANRRCRFQSWTSGQGLHYRVGRKSLPKIMKSKGLSQNQSAWKTNSRLMPMKIGVWFQTLKQNPDKALIAEEEQKHMKWETPKKSLLTQFMPTRPKDQSSAMNTANQLVLSKKKPNTLVLLLLKQDWHLMNLTTWT